jgi:hypothetical protein
VALTGSLLAVDPSFDCVEVKAQGNELTRGTTELVQNIRLYGEFTSAQERCFILQLAISLTPVGRRGYFTSTNDFYLPSLLD